MSVLSAAPSGGPVALAIPDFRVGCTAALDLDGAVLSGYCLGAGKRCCVGAHLAGYPSPDGHTWCVSAARSQGALCLAESVLGSVDAAVLCLRMQRAVIQPPTCYGKCSEMRALLSRGLCQSAVQARRGGAAVEEGGSAAGTLPGWIAEASYKVVHGDGLSLQPGLIAKLGQGAVQVGALCKLEYLC